ncbi:MAG: membrane protein insertase YidC [Sphingomonas sp.]|nr:membrane protein insertase YidC [Sphingomonas sp.]RZV51605.1 MAG: membrane protein insertase YidC [Sphingomonadaceae bacterium]
MGDNKNLILALVLSAMVLFGWSILFPTSTEDLPAEQPVNEQVVPSAGDTVAANDAAPLPPRSLEDALEEDSRVAIETPRLEGSINLVGGRIDDLTMTDHTVALDGESGPVRLLSPSRTPEAYFTEFGWTSDGIDVPTSTTRWTSDGQVLTPQTPVTLSWSNDSGQTFKLVFEVDENYLFTVDQRIENRGAGAVGVGTYARARRAGIDESRTMFNVHNGPMGVFNNEATYDVDYDDLEDDGAQSFSTTGGWIGFTDKYWLTALIPSQDNSVRATMQAIKGDGGDVAGYQTDFVGNGMIVEPGTAKIVESRLFAGAKEKKLLDDYERAGVQRLSKSIDWGWFEWFMRPIFDLLRWLFMVTGNFGVAIILLTVLVRLVLYPIANKQFRSFAGMRRVQPKLKALQDRYKDDKPKLQQEMMKLYQAEKINPLAGCLPILLQIPIFYALYKVLLVSVEMRHQPFVLWLKDLSAPDPLTPINLFGLLDFTPPSFIAIGVLPILLGVSMWLQFKLNPTPVTDPVQKQIFGIMPWVLMVVMAPFAAGLQLYWVANNILTLAQQKFFYWRYDKDNPPEVVEAKATKA